MPRFSMWVALLSLFLCAPADAQSLRDPALQLDSLVPVGLSGPTTMDFVGPDDFLVLEKEGTVRRVKDGVLSPTLVLAPNVNPLGERGMLGIAVDRMSTPIHVFLYYTENSVPFPGGIALGNRVYRYDWDGETGTLTRPVLVLDLPISPVTGHNGGVLVLGPPGQIPCRQPDEDPFPNPELCEDNGRLLYTVIGDLDVWGGNLQNIAGGVPPNDTSVILRVRQDGRPAPGNPFTPYCSHTTSLTCSSDEECPGEEICRTEVARYYAYGVRNSFGLAIDPKTGALWDTENGVLDYDEVNRVEPGMNSGWIQIMGPDARDPQGVGDLFHMPAGVTYSDPEFSWFSTIGPTGIVFPRFSTLGPQWEKAALVADVNFGRILALPLNGPRTAFAVAALPGLSDLVADSVSEEDPLLFASELGPITDLKQGPDGNLYVVTHVPPNVFRVRGPASVPLQPWFALPALIALLAASGMCLARRR